MQIVVTAESMDTRESVTNRCLGILHLMKDSGLGADVVTLCPILAGKESAVHSGAVLLQAVGRLLEWIGGDAITSCEIEVVYPGQVPFRTGGFGIVTGGMRCVVDCPGPVCKVLLLRGDQIESVRNCVPTDVVRSDDGVTLTVVAKKGRSQFARFLLRIQQFLLTVQADEEVRVSIR